MAAHGLTTQDVEAAVRRENAEIPAGRVEGDERDGYYEYALAPKEGASA